MSYSPGASSNSDPKFDNVFVTPDAYHAFLGTGRWPDHTMFALEVRSSEGHSSIHQQGHYQGALAGIEVEVKDEHRFPGTWPSSIFAICRIRPRLPNPPPAIPAIRKNGAVDNTLPLFSSIRVWRA